MGVPLSTSRLRLAPSRIQPTHEAPYCPLAREALLSHGRLAYGTILAVGVKGPTRSRNGMQESDLMVTVEGEDKHAHGERRQRRRLGLIEDNTVDQVLTIRSLGTILYSLNGTQRFLPTTSNTT